MKDAPTVKRTFYVAVSAVMALIALVGFWPSYFGPLVRLSVERSAVIHFHALVYVGWLALFITQAALAATGRMAAHRSLGRFGIAYGVIVIAVGVGTTLYQFAGRIEANGLDASLAYPTWPLIDMAIFAPFFALAVAYRRRPEVHKRLMVVATTTLLVAAAGRMPLEFNWVRAVWFSPILLGLAYDAFKCHQVHPVYAIGLTVLFVSSFRDAVMQTDTLLAFVRWLGAALA
jgi:hypothetical protein